LHDCALAEPTGRIVNDKSETGPSSLWSWLSPGSSDSARSPSPAGEAAKFKFEDRLSLIADLLALKHHPVTNGSSALPPR